MHLYATTAPNVYYKLTDEAWSVLPVNRPVACVLVGMSQLMCCLDPTVRYIAALSDAVLYETDGY